MDFLESTMADEVVNSTHGFKRSELVIAKGTVTKDGDIAPAAAERLFREYCTKVGDTDDESRRATRLALAVALSNGTSADTDFSQRYLDSEDPDSSLIYLVDVLTAEGSPLAHKTNFMRVFARSLPAFADLTRDAIRANSWLAQERALDYEVDLPVAGVCFDYAEKVDMSKLTPTEKQMVIYGLRKKAREGRSSIMTPEGSGVRGSDPVSRGVGASVVPDAGRLGVGGARGAGPYA